MKMRKLGRTGLDVSEICLGTMTWGSQNSEAEAHEQMDYAVERGINFFDTAEMYPTTPRRDETHGGTEEIIGTWFEARGQRDDITVATKVLGPGGFPKPHGDEITPKKIRRACEDSLQRLKTDYIDLYQLHWANRGSYCFRQNWGYAPWKQDTKKALADIEAALEELAKLQQEGKIRHAGLSNETAWGVSQYVRLAGEKGLPRMASIQNEYSLLDRKFDLDLAETCHHEDVGLLTYSSLAAGLLTGKYADGQMPQGSRRTINDSLGGRVTPYLQPALDNYLALAKKHDVNPTHMALAWCLTRPFVTSVIIGATTMEQLKTCIDVEDVTLDEALMADIEAVYREYPFPI